MNQETTFVYRYSAKENDEIQKIRQKYLPCEENKFKELKRLDYTVQNAGRMESLCVGIGGALIFGIGICLAMQVIASGLLFKILGILIGIIGTAGMLIAYPIYCKTFNKTKGKLAPRILKLAEELSGGKF
ncbi:MAG: hypothetical protein IJE02_03550 [Clostridia bacterium]|nr:hypothetical protein [Clostridia bacterium]